MAKRRMPILLASILPFLGCMNAEVHAQASVRLGSNALTAELQQPEDVALDASGNLYVSEFVGDEVDLVDGDGALTVVAGTGVAGYSGTGGLATETQLNAPTGLTFDPNGNLVIADHHNQCIRTIGASGSITTIAGTCTKHGTQA